MNRANVIRPRMTKLKETAEKTGCAIVLVGHMNKNSAGKASYRSLGSIDISAAARSVLVVGKLNKTSDVRVLAPLKNNLAPKGKSISFKIKDGALEWLSECDLSADELLSGNVSGGSKMFLAEDFLRVKLQDGIQSAKSLIEEAEEQGISERTLKKAKSNLSIRSVKKNGSWYWKISD